MDTHQDMDPLASFQHQHGEVSEWLALIAALPDPAGSVSFAAWAARMEAAFRSFVLPHMRWEEGFLFPALRALDEDAALPGRLAELCAEHAFLRERIEGTLLALKGPSPQADMVAQALEALAGLRDRLLLHAAIEDELIVPLLERHGAALGQRIGGAGAADRREGG